MASLKGIIDEIGRLSARDRRVVIKHLEQVRTQPRKRARTRSIGRREPPYAALIELAGGAHSSAVDVSTDKYRHLGAAYADKHGAP
jgi:hypothetical protein